MQTKLDKAFKIIVDISNRKVTIPQAISWYVTDENIAHLNCQIIDEVEDSIIDIQSYKLSMRVLTPSRILKEVNYTLSDATNNIFTLTLPDELITEKGRHQCELSVEYLGDKLTSEPFNYNIIQSIANQLDSTISKDSHYPLVLELEDKLKEWNNILDEQVSKVIILDNDCRNAEKTRQANEAQRIEAENQRQKGYTEFKNEVSEQLNIATIILTPEMYECVGDGVTDDTVNFQRCINDAVKRGAMINGLGKTYMISDIQKLPSHIESKDYGLYIEGSLYMYNCNFVLKDGCLGRTTVLNIANPKNTNVALDNIYIDGNGNNQSTTITSQDGGIHGIRVSYSNMDAEVGGFEIRNSTVTNCYSDCICIRPKKFDFCNIKNSKIILGGRNGITDNAYSSVVENCQFIDNGWRTAPRSGYHIEPDTSFDFGRKVMRDCIISNSQVTDYKIHYNSNIYNMDALIIENCSMKTLGLAHYCKTECYTNDIIINNSTIAKLTSGNGNNDLSLHVVRNVKVNNSQISFVRWESAYEPTEFGNLFFNNAIFNLGDSNIYLYGDYNAVIFDKCMFTREFEDVDAVRNNCFYFDYETVQTLTEPQTTKKVAFTNCVFNNINRCLHLGTSTNRLIDNFIFKDNIVNNRHLVMSGSSVKNAIIDGNTFRHIGTNSAGTAGKIRFDADCNSMIATNNIFFMNETSAFGPNKPVNCIKANNLFDITE